MKEKSMTSYLYPMCVRNLRIKTKIRLHPEFFKSPHTFARRNKVPLAGDVFAETDFRNVPDAKYPDARIEKAKFNIHLVRHGAIRLFASRDDEGDWLKSIDLNPAMLLHEKERAPLHERDLPVSLSVLKTHVSPLLADPLDARHIVPGLVQAEDQIAYWSEIDSELVLPWIEISCLHGLSHPTTGPAGGVKKDRIQFGDKKDDCLIRIKQARFGGVDPNGTKDVEGIRVRLILQGNGLTREFPQFGTTALIDDTNRLVSFPELSIAQVHQSVMTRLDGSLLPVPQEWKDKAKGRSVTVPKVIALVSQLTSIPLEELIAIDEEVRQPSESTRKRLKSDVPAAAALLKPVQISSLFCPEAYASQVRGTKSPVDKRMDPRVAEIYG